MYCEFLPVALLFGVGVLPLKCIVHPQWIHSGYSDKYAVVLFTSIVGVTLSTLIECSKEGVLVGRELVDNFSMFWQAK